MRDDIGHFILGVGTGGAVFFVVGLLVGRCIERGDWWHASVKAGHAEFYLDAEHNRQWRWLDVKPNSRDAAQEER